jgi:hypothetical protein
MRKIGSCLLAYLMGISPGLFAQEQQKYKLSILDDASTVKRVKGGRVSSQVVVKVTDENDRPMPAIAIIFTIPQGSGGATFASTGGLTASVTTNSAGLATSGSFTASASSTFSMSVTASTPAGPLTVSVPVNMPTALASVGSTAAGGGGASHTGLIIGVLAGVGAAGAVAAKVLSGGKNNNPQPTPPSTISGQIGSATGGTFGPH